MIRNCLTALLAAFAFNAFAAIDANRANQAELESVKGIGPGLSTRILEARKTASFKDWSDLQQRVSGVGPNNASRFSLAGLTVGGNAFQISTSAPATKPTKASKGKGSTGSAPDGKVAKSGKSGKSGKAAGAEPR
jgi:competence protein ComEA